MDPQRVEHRNAAVLVADVVGHGRLMAGDAVATLRALACLRAEVSSLVEGHGGRVVDTAGDNLLAELPTALDAARCALAIQLARSDANAALPAPRRMELRVGVHRAAVLVSGGQIYGEGVNVAARLEHLAEPGGICVSREVESEVRHRLAAHFVDLGERLLKNIPGGVRVFRMRPDARPVASRPAEPATPTAPPAPPTNLPLEITPFVGRQGELSRVGELLEGTHLLTLAGPGGAGKTRLARQAAAQRHGLHPDGTFFVELAPLSDPSLIAQEVASTLGVPDEGEGAVAEAVLEHLAARDLLLVLDNCEHLVDGAAAFVSAALRRCPRLWLLATSREPLEVEGEMVWRVPPMDVGDPERSAVFEEQIRTDAVQLFVSRARAARPGFELAEPNLESVVSICRQVDGIPLAIELAAAQVGSTSPAEIACRLRESFAVLASRSRDRPAHQRTLEAALDWSVRLLGEDERRLLERLSVFSGGFSLAAVEAVCADDALPAARVVDGLHRLVVRSLVERDHTGEEDRYRMLETVRVFAHERLRLGELEGLLEARHRDHAVRLVEAAQGALALDPGCWMKRLAQDQENLRAALRRALDARDAETSLRLAGGLALYWVMRGNASEGRAWLEEALALAGDAAPATEAAALHGAAMAAALDADYERSEALLGRSLRLYRLLGGERRIAWLHFWMGRNRTVRVFLGAAPPDDLAAAERHYSLALKLMARRDDRLGAALVLPFSAWNALLAGDPDAFERLAEAERRAEAVGVRHAVAMARGHRANLLGARGEAQRATELAAEAVEMLDALGDRLNQQICLSLAASLALSMGEAGRARSLAGQALALLLRLRAREWEPLALAVAALVLGEEGRPDVALRVMGALDRLAPRWPVPLGFMALTDVAARRARVEAALGPAEGEHALRDGARLGLRAAVELAHRALSSAGPPS